MASLDTSGQCAFHAGGNGAPPGMHLTTLPLPVYPYCSGAMKVVMSAVLRFTRMHWPPPGP